MTLLNTRNVHHALRQDGQPEPFARRAIYTADTDQLAPLFDDPGLTRLRANPMLADANGVFGTCYMMPGVYTVVVSSQNGQVLNTFTEVQVKAPLLTSTIHEFQSLATMLEDELLNYDQAADRYNVAAGDLLRVSDGNFQYCVAAQEAQNPHFVTEGGVKLYAQPNGEGDFTARQFGAVENSDITDALQAAIDAALHNVNRTDGFVAGVLIDIHAGSLSRTIHCSYGGLGPKTITVRGFGGMYTDNVDSASGTALQYLPTSGCAFAIQGGRKPKLKGFICVGRAADVLNDFTKEGTTPPTNSLAFMVPSRYDAKTWDVALASVGVVPNRRYAPYAGVAIDPRSGDRPADLTISALTTASPAVITTSTAHNLNSNVPETIQVSGLSAQGIADGEYYAVHLTATTAQLWNLDWTATTGTGPGTGTLAFPYYAAPTYPAGEGTGSHVDPDISKKRTSSFVVEDVVFRGFEVGTVVNPGTLGNNGDFGQFNQVDVSNSKFAHAVCQPNARINHYYRCNPFGIYCYLTTGQYGEAIGNANAKVEGMGGGYMVKWFEVPDTTRLGATTFDNCHPEGVGMIGTMFTGGSGSQPIVFQNSIVKFQHDWGQPPTLLENFGADPAPVSFIGGEIRTRYGASLMTDNLKMFGTCLSRQLAPVKAYSAQAFNNAHICPVRAYTRLGSRVSARYDLSTGTPVITDTTDLGDGLIYTGRNHGIPCGSAQVSSNPRGENPSVAIDVPYHNGTIGAGQRSFGASPVSDRSITWTFTSYTGDRMRQNGIANGCLLMDQNTGVLMSIRSVNYTTGEVICTLESNWFDDGVNPPGLFDPDWDWTVNTWRIFRTDLFIPPSRIFGNFTAGSNVITNVRTIGRMNESNFGLGVGDWYAAYLGAAGVYNSDDTAITAINTSPAAIGITGVTAASPAVVTTGSAHGFVDGQLVDIAGVGGATWINGGGYVVEVLTATTFALRDGPFRTPVDGTGFGAYTSGGTAKPCFGTITLTDTARRDAADVPLDFWLRTAPANEASV
jgi:hypothetical protein